MVLGQERLAPYDDLLAEGWMANPGSPSEQQPRDCPRRYRRPRSQETVRINRRMPGREALAPSARLLFIFDHMPERRHATRMASTSRWVFLARGSLLAAICGHWIANWVLDKDEYTRAGLEYTWRASIPIVVQTILVLLVVVVLGPLSARRTATENSRAPSRSYRLNLLTLLTTSQLLLFLLLEVSERIVQREPFTDGLLASGFALELLFAIGSALLLAGLGSVALRVIRSPRRQPTTTAIEARIGLTPESVACIRPLILVGDVRAPPLVAV